MVDNKKVDSKWEKQLGYDIDIEVIEAEEDMPIVVDNFSVKVEKDKETKNEYLVRYKKNDLGEREYHFKELKPSNDEELENIVSEGKSWKDYEKEINDKKNHLKKIKEAEEKRKKKINLNKKSIKDIIIKLGREQKALEGVSLGGSYRRRNRYGRPEYLYLHVNGVYIPLKWRLRAYLVDIANEAKRESSTQSRIKTKRQFAAGKTNWGQVITWIFTIIVFGVNIWFFMHQLDLQSESSYEQLKKENVFVINEFNKLLKDNAQICQDLTGFTIDTLKEQGFATEVNVEDKTNIDSIEQ